VDAYLRQHITHSPDDMSLESDGGITYLQGKSEELGENPVPVPLCPPQIPHGLTQARKIWTYAALQFLSRSVFFSGFEFYITLGCQGMPVVFITFGCQRMPN
jgi:hypothetical protein